MENEEGVVVKGRATIDTRPPFGSVKEAVALFGERVVGQIYAKQFKEIQTKTSSDKENVTSTLGAVTAELEETKENLKKAKEEGNYMANCLKSLQQELEQTKKELRKMKSAKDVVIEHPRAINPEIEELKFVENPMSKRNSDEDRRRDIYHQQNELQKKKFVSFASPPSLTRDILHGQGDQVVAATRFGRTPSFRTEGKKKPLIPIVGWIFPRKKRSYEGSDRSPKV